jgi:predicted O-methyltransferase YrrM
MVKDLVKEIEEYAEREKVPIIQEESLKYLIDYIKVKNVKSVLEVGTAIGYSAICMALSNPDLKITTIERDEKRYLEAIKNIKKFNLEKRITLIFKDALDVFLEEKYDLIFIDAAKAQNINFFNHFEKNLSKNGTVITDNIFFHGFTYMNPEEIESRNVRAIARKIRDYIDFLEQKKEYETVIRKIGDGISVTRRKDGYEDR